MKTYRKIIAILLAVGLVLPGAGLVAMADTVEKNVTRLSGDDRYETAVAVSKEAYKGTADAVVLAGGMAEVDALTGTLLAAAKEAPLLYTHKDTLTPVTKDRILALKAKTVYILGGENVVSKAVVEQLEALGLNVQRVHGDDRYETAVAVAEEAETLANHAFIVVDGVGSSSLVDALAVGPASYTKKYPVLLVGKDKLPTATKLALRDLGITSVTVIGGTSAISANVVNELNSITNLTVTKRLSGDTRDETALAIANEYFATSKEAVLANGYATTLVDALVGGYLGGMKKAPVLYSRIDTMAKKTEAQISGLDTVYLLGGENVTSALLANRVKNVITPVEVKSVTPLTKRVDKTALAKGEAVLEFNVNGKKADLDLLELAGYNVLFRANKNVFVDKGFVSNTGKLKAVDSQDLVEYLEYDVVISREGTEVARTAKQKVTVVNLENMIENITAVEVKQGKNSIEGVLPYNDVPAEVTVKGILYGETKEKDITNLVDLTVDKFSVLRLIDSQVKGIALGTATLTATSKDGFITKSINIEVKAARKATTATLDKTEIKLATTNGEGSIGNTETIKVTLKDQYGQAIHLDEDNLKLVDSDVISQANVTEVSGKKGQFNVKVTSADVKKAVTKNVKLTADGVEVATLKITVGIPEDKIAKYEIRVTENKSTNIDLKTEANGERTVKLVGLDKQGFVIKENVDGFEIKLDATTIATYSEDSKTVTLESTAKVGDKFVLRAYPTNTGFTDAKASLTFTVVDTTPVITNVTFKAQNLITKAGKHDLKLADLLTVETDRNVEIFMTELTTELTDSKIEIREKNASGELLGTLTFKADPSLYTVAAKVGDVNKTVVLTIEDNSEGVNAGAIKVSVVRTDKKHMGQTNILVEVPKKEGH